MSKPRTLIAIGGQPLRDEIVRATAGDVELGGVLPGPAALVEQLDAGADLVIADLATVRAIARHHRIRRAPRQDRPVIVLALAAAEFEDVLGLLEYCQGFLFWQHGFATLGARITLALEGYCSVPASSLPDLLSDRIRIGRVGRLTTVERHVFQLLGEAKSNRVIAEALAVPEPVAKSLVRAVLAKLRLKNRTEAAVLATRLHGIERDADEHHRAPPVSGHMAS